MVAFIIGSFYYYTFHYRPKLITVLPKSVFEYLSICYYNRPDKFYWTFYKIPTDLKTSFGHFGYAIIRVVIIGGVLATFHNVCQFYDVAFYNTFREIVVRPLYV
ncbi:MAG: hypothetical protein MUE72_04635, partial [Chitinophagaceae bacterium]|nr:hypothetical protein [Chitinophagaceae bacterium]